MVNVSEIMKSLSAITSPDDLYSHKNRSVRMIVRILPVLNSNGVMPLHDIKKRLSFLDPGSVANVLETLAGDGIVQCSEVPRGRIVFCDNGDNYIQTDKSTKAYSLTNESRRLAEQLPVFE